jgi:hypothetical protein
MGLYFKEVHMYVPRYVGNCGIYVTLIISGSIIFLRNLFENTGSSVPQECMIAGYYYL